jgi:Phosphopantetheine attachment site
VRFGYAPQRPRESGSVRAVVRVVSVVEREAVLEAVGEATGLAPAELGSGWSLLDLGLTSYRIMQALMEIEERFGIELSEDEVVKFPVLPASALVDLIGTRIATMR